MGSPTIRSNCIAICLNVTLSMTLIIEHGNDIKFQLFLNFCYQMSPDRFSGVHNSWARLGENTALVKKDNL